MKSTKTDTVEEKGRRILIRELKKRGHTVESLKEFAHAKDLVVDGKIDVQVKISSSAQWQLHYFKLLKVDVINDIQHFKQLRKLPHPEMVWLFYSLSEKEVFILTERDVQRLVAKDIKGYYGVDDRHDKIVRTKNPFSDHCALKIKHLNPYKDNWRIFKR